jgi:hypothetical protein
MFFDLSPITRSKDIRASSATQLYGTYGTYVRQRTVSPHTTNASEHSSARVQDDERM